MNINKYLQRINYQGSLTPTITTLKKLHHSHMLSVPFENLSIHWHEPILLNEDALYDKIVRRQRGGFCYELNGLFAALCRNLGFDIVKISAQVSNGDGSYSPEFDHMALLVTLEDRWLVDVGFGDSFREPLLLDSKEGQKQYGRNYKIHSDDDTFTMSQQKSGEEWIAQYRFTLRPYQFADYVPRCHFHQTSPDSHFQQSKVCSLATENGRLTLSDNLLISTTFAGKREESELPNEEIYLQALATQFGITPTPPPQKNPFP